MQYRKLILGITLLASFGFGAAFADGPNPGEVEVKVTAQKFEFNPNPIMLKLNQPVVLEVTTLDREHGFFSQQLGIDETINLGQTTYIHLNPTKAGTFPFSCSVFCGTGHEGMQGTIVVQ